VTEATKARDAICRVGRSLFDRGLTAGSTGNISVRLSNGELLMTPTNASLGTLDPAELSHLDAAGAALGGKPQTKEAFLHQCMYCSRPRSDAVIHLHSTHSVAVSLLAGLPTDDILPPLTAYYVMRVGKLPLVPYFPPGDKVLAEAVKQLAADHHAVLLSNHGPIVAGGSLEEAQYAIEELEETAKLFLLLWDRSIRPLTPEQVADLRERFPHTSAR